MKRTIIDIDIIHTLPPSCVNRDASGTPKSAIYGGTSRIRVSSQAWKAAVRDHMRQAAPDRTGLRTKEYVAEVARRLSDGPPDQRTLVLVGGMFDFVKKLGDSHLPIEPGPIRGGAMAFLAPAQLDAVATLFKPVMEDAEAADLADEILTINTIQENSTDAKAVKETKEARKKANGNLVSYLSATYKALRSPILDSFKENQAADISLFGRMMASGQDLNIDAACQVAHALSVHTVSPEWDYFTGVDDTYRGNEVDTADVTMIGQVGFASSTMYRYANVDVNRLADNLDSDEDAVEVAVDFVDTFARVMPTGKQNTFANLTRPDTVVVTIRDTQAINAAGAFERALISKNGYAEKATEQLAAHLTNVEATYGEKPVKRFVMSLAPESASALGVDAVSLPELVKQLTSFLNERTEDAA